MHNNSEHINLPDYLRQGNIEQDQLLQTLQQMQNALITATGNTLRSIRINTPNLEYALYNHDPFISALTGFIRDNRHASVQILVQDIREAIQQGHALIRLAQRLTSSIEIRKPTSKDNFKQASFVVFDNIGFFYRNAVGNTGVYNQQCKHRATNLLEFFTPAWEQAEQDIETRRLSI